MTEAKRDTPDYLTAWSHCRSAAENCYAQFVKHGERSPGYKTIYQSEAISEFAKAAAALGYRLVEIEPAPVTSAAGFDGRDGGRFHEISSAQEGV